MEYNISPLRDSDVMVVGHWDTDGICSTAKFKLYVNSSAEFYTPPIGSYTIPTDDFKRLGGYEYIVVLDIAVRDDNLGELAESTGSQIVVIDHHFHTSRRNALYIDPPMESGERFYSNTLLIDHILNRDMDILTVLGLVGDVGMRIRDKPIYNDVSRILDIHGLSLEDVYRMVLLIDSNHIVNDREAVKKAVDKVLQYVDDPHGILDEREWINRYDEAIREVERLSGDDGIVRGDRWIYKELDSHYYIISRVGRRISSRYRGLVTIVVNRGFFPQYDQVYIRSNAYPMEMYRLIDYALSRGYVAGGKDNVMGAITPKEETDEFVSIAKSFIEDGALPPRDM